MPRPRKGESEGKFIHRCMKHPHMKEKHPNHKDRYGACKGYWDYYSKKRGG